MTSSCAAKACRMIDPRNVVQVRIDHRQTLSISTRTEVNNNQEHATPKHSN